MSNLPAIGHGLFAGYVGDNLAIDCYWPDESNPPPRGCRVVVQRADVPDLLKAILVADGKAPPAGYKATMRWPTLDSAASVPADAGGSLPVGLMSSAAIAMQREATNATPTRAGSLHAALIAHDEAGAAAADERALWRALAIASARGGNSPFAAAKEATMALAEYRKLFGPKAPAPDLRAKIEDLRNDWLSRDTPDQWAPRALTDILEGRDDPPFRYGEGEGVKP